MHSYQHVFLHRGPSRVFWFLIGGGVATWWHHSAIMRDHRAQYFPCVIQRHRVHEPPTDTPPQDPAPWKSTWGLDRNEHDGQRWRHLQNRAGETVVDLSESTLDSIVAGAESLKVKLAELRAERERLEAEKKVAHPAA